MNREALIDYIACIPDLVSHKFLDIDGYYSTRMHGAREVAFRVVNALEENYDITEKDAR